MKRKPYIIGIKETYIKQVIVFADSEKHAEVSAEDLCNQCVIDVGLDDFVSRSTESYGIADLPIDMQIYEAYGSRKHISEMKKGDILIHEGQLYTAAADATLCSRDEGEDWCVKLQGTLPEDLYVYGSYFPEGMVDIAQPAQEQTRALSTIVGDAESRNAAHPPEKKTPGPAER